MFSEKKIDVDFLNPNKAVTNKSIKSNKTIQFKNTNEFERFTYVKENNKENAGRPSSRRKISVDAAEGDGSCCSLM